MNHNGAAEVGSDAGPASPVSGPLPNHAQIWLIRHGETEWSKSGQHTSRTDLPLTKSGELQARALSGMLAGVKPSLVLSSPRQRALRTAELAGIAVDAIDEDLSEWDYGDYEGLTTQQIREHTPGWTIWNYPVPGGETAAQVTARADRVLKRASTHLADGPVILLGHGHISRVLGARWIGLAARDGGRFALGTAAPSILGVEHGAPVIDRWNIPNPEAEQSD